MNRTDMLAHLDGVTRGVVEAKGELRVNGSGGRLWETAELRPSSGYGMRPEGVKRWRACPIDGHL